MQQDVQLSTPPGLEPGCVFVSHNQKEKAWVRRMVQQWRALGLEVFFDEDSIPGGEDVLGALERGISGCRHMVLIVSRASLASQWVARELAMAAARGSNGRDRRIIPVLIEPVDHEDLGLFLLSRSMIDLTREEERQARYHHLLRSLGLNGADLPAPPSFDAPVAAARMGEDGGRAEDDGARATTATTQAEIELVLNGDLDDFTAERERNFIEAVKLLLKTDDVVIRSKRRGSIILTLGLTPEEAERLLWAVRAGALDEFGVRGATLLEPEEEPEEPEPWREPPSGEIEGLAPRPSEAKRVLLLKRQSGQASAPMSPIPPAPREKDLPLSFAQERLWLLEQLDPGGAFATACEVLLEGALNARTLEHTLGEVIARHEALRTVFRVGKEYPVQVVLPATSFVLPVHDLSHLLEPERAETARRLAEQAAAGSFDLAAGPLFRARLLRLAEDEHRLLLVAHPMIADSQSMDVLVRELSVLYTALTRGEPWPLPTVPVQYADYTVWEREQLRGGVLERQLAWWLERLAGAPTLLELPTDRSRPAVQSHHSAVHRFAMAAAEVEPARALARAETGTLFMVLLAAWKALLSRYSGQGNVVVGTPLLGRTHREMEGMIGPLASFLPLRTDHSGDPTFRELLRQVREAALGAYRHPDVQFPVLVEALEVERNLAHAPVFQVLFALEHDPAEVLYPARMRWSRVRASGGPSPFDLALTLREHGHGFDAELSFATGLFDASTAERMARHYRMLLAAFTARPELLLSEADLLDESERDRLL
ncbi:MAG TPA: condensation domain-containing protein, partial [Longimicrobiaceae bacterium]|nr:condensation domain-containing protein [Longimicrobiaceae bacterium]